MRAIRPVTTSLGATRVGTTVRTDVVPLLSTIQGSCVSHQGPSCVPFVRFTSVHRVKHTTPSIPLHLPILRTTPASSTSSTPWWANFAPLAIATSVAYGSVSELESFDEDEFSDQDFEDWYERLDNATSHTKLFKAMASSSKGGEKRMTTKDFCRAIFSRHAYFTDKVPDLSKFPALQCIGDNEGRISFQEYILLTTLISVPVDQYDTVFRMLDTDGNGEISEEELVAAVHILSRGVVDDATMTSVSAELNPSTSRLCRRLFYGKDMRTKAPLTIARFDDFVSQLKQDIDAVSFQVFSPGSGSMTRLQFAHYLAGLESPTEFRKLLPDLQELGSVLSPEPDSKRITLEQYTLFRNCFGAYADELMVILSLCGSKSGGDTVSRDELSRAMYVASGVQMPFQVVNTMFRVYTGDPRGDLPLSVLAKMGSLLSRGAVAKKPPPARGWAGFTACLETVLKDSK